MEEQAAHNSNKASKESASSDDDPTTGSNQTFVSSNIIVVVKITRCLTEHAQCTFAISHQIRAYLKNLNSVFMADKKKYVYPPISHATRIDIGKLNFKSR